MDSQQLLVGLGCLKALDQRHQRSHTLLISANRVHREFIEVAEFLFQRTFLVGILLKFLQNTVHPLVVLFLQTVETAIAGIGCRQGIVLHPPTTSILVEVIGGSHRGVEVSLVKSRTQTVLGHCHH